MGSLHLDRAIGQFFDRVARDPIKWSLMVTVAAVFVGGTIFSLAEENTSMPDGWWWAFVSLTTVGYGDISPKTTEIRFLAMFVIASGLLSAWIMGAAIVGRVTQRRLAMSHETPELDDDVMKVADDLRGAAEALEAIAPKLSKIHAEESDDHANWREVDRIAGYIIGAANEPSKQRLRELARQEGVRNE